MTPYAIPCDLLPRWASLRSSLGGHAATFVRATLLLLAIGSGGGLATESSADTVLVLPDGTGDFPTIEAAINASADGDMILLGDGGFHGPGNRDVSFQGKAITVRSAAGDPEACTIFCNGSVNEPHRGFLFTNDEPPGAVLQDVTITGGCALQGGAVHVFDGATPTIVGCVFRGNQASGGQHGGGAVCATYSTRIEDCLFENNVGRSGGGLLLRSGGGVIVTGCTFRNNEASANGGAIYYASQPRVEGCLFIGNWAGGDGGALYGGTIHLGGSTFAGNTAGGGAGALSIVNSGNSLVSSTTITHNTSGSGGSVRLGPTSFTEFNNVIIAFDTAGRAVNVGQVPPLFFCCDLYGNAGGDWVGPIEGQLGENGNISLDPLLCGSQWGDFGLRADSPCRPFSEPNPACGAIGAHPVGCQTSEAACCMGTDCEVLTAEACYLAEGVWLPGIETCDPNPCDADTILVRPDGSGDVPYIQEALDYIGEGGTILLADGVFGGFGNRDLDFHGKAVTLRSQSGSADGCVIDCSGSAADPHRAIDFTEAGPQTRVEFITMRNGFADRGGAIHCRSGSSPTLHGCVLANNAAPFRGGALYVDQGSPRIEACTFVGNQTSGEGGAAHFAVGSHVDLADCRFESNLAGGLGGGAHIHAYCDGGLVRCALLGNQSSGGGGLFLDGSIHLERCTFCANDSDEGSAVGVGANAELTMDHSILAFGSGSPPVACASGGAPVMAACCDLFGNQGGDWVGCVEELAGQFGNFSDDPLFCEPLEGNLYLHEDSPCANAPECGLVGAYGVGCGFSDVPESHPPVPHPEFRLGPSPTTGRVVLECVLGPPAESKPVTLHVFDATGRRVVTLLDLPHAKRVHRVVWDGRLEGGIPAPAGVYYARLSAAGWDARRPILLLR